MADSTSAAPVVRGAAQLDAAREWPTADLARRVDRALDAAADVVQRLAATMGRANALEPPDRALIDIAILLREAVSVPKFLAPAVPARARELARALANLARHPRVALAILAQPARAREYAAPHLVLSAFGLSDDAFDRVLGVALDAPMRMARERLPHRELEQAWIASLSGTPTISGDAVQRTALHCGMDLIFGERDDLRALAHGIMFATDFGRRAPVSVRSSHVAAMAESALAGALDDGDLMLAAELLHAWPLLHEAWTPAANVAFLVLSRASDDETSTRVMGTLCASTLRARRHPLTLPPLGLGDAARADALLHLIQRDDARPAWLGEVIGLSDERRASCEAFLRDVVLRRAARRLDFEGVKGLLQETHEQGVVTTPLCAQCVGLLRRVSSSATPAVARGA